MANSERGRPPRRQNAAAFKSDQLGGQISNNFTHEISLRQRAFDLGYHPVPLLTGQKHTLQPGWQVPDLRRPERVDPTHANTGILCAGLRVVDVDIDNAATALFVCVAVTRTLGEAPYRKRAGSPRRAYLYRAAEGSPGKLQLKGQRGGIEVLGNGQQLHAFGRHPDGAMLEWPHGGPADIAVADLPTVTEEQVATLFERCRGAIGAPEPEGPLAGTQDGPSSHISSLSAWSRATLEARAAEVAGLQPGEQGQGLFRIALKCGHDVHGGRLPGATAFDVLLSAAMRMRNQSGKAPWTRADVVRTIRRAFEYARAARAKA